MPTKVLPASQIRNHRYVMMQDRRMCQRKVCLKALNPDEPPHYDVDI